MASEQFTITRSPLWAFKGDITVSIECDPMASTPIKLGLAVRAAVTSGANLSGADLSGADLSGANLSGANLFGAKVRDEEVARAFAIVSRFNDPYVFTAFELKAGGVKILAGCRWFTVAEFIAHVAEEYPDTDKARETLNILDFIEARASALGIDLAPKAEEAKEAP